MIHIPHIGRKNYNTCLVLIHLQAIAVNTIPLFKSPLIHFTKPYTYNGKKVIVFIRRIYSSRKKLVR